MIAATTCLYFLICGITQYIKGIDEEKQKNMAIQIYNERGRLETEEEEDDRY